MFVMFAFFFLSDIAAGGYRFGETVSVLHLINSPVASNSAEGTANGLLQHIAKVLGGNTQVEFRIPQQVVNFLLSS